MSTIKKLEIKNILGIKELILEPGSVNIIKGPTGCGKTSILDAIGVAYRNASRGGEVVHKDGEKGEIFIEQSDGRTLDRKINKQNKTTTLNYRTSEGAKFSSAGTMLKGIFPELSFLPSEFMGKSSKVQKDIILRMIPIDFDKEKFIETYGETGINLNLHPLEIYKKLEKIVYDERSAKNSKLKTLQNELNVMKTKVPEDFDYDKWKDFSLSNLSKEIVTSQNMNIKLNVCKDYIDNYDQNLKDVLEPEGRKIKKEFYAIKVASENTIKEYKEEIEILQAIVAKEEDYLNDLDKKIDNAIKQNNDKIIAHWQETKNDYQSLLENNKIVDIDTLQKDMETAEENKGLLKIYDEKKRISDTIDDVYIEAAKLQLKLDEVREKPNEILSNAEIPIEGFAIDAKGNVTINDLDINNLSDGEKFKMVVKIAIAGLEQNDETLKLICVDGFEKLDSWSQELFIEYLKGYPNIQFFITCVDSSPLSIEKY